MWVSATVFKPCVTFCIGIITVTLSRALFPPQKNAPAVAGALEVDEDVKILFEYAGQGFQLLGEGGGIKVKATACLG